MNGTGQQLPYRYHYHDAGKLTFSDVTRIIRYSMRNISTRQSSHRNNNEKVLVLLTDMTSYADGGEAQIHPYRAPAAGER